MSDPTSVLFVCMGNICRSPMGEGAMNRLLDERRLVERVHVDSAGTIDYHAGKPPDPRMRAAAARRDYDLVGQSRPIRRRDLKRFDLIVAMDRENLVDIISLAGGRQPENVCLLSDFLSDGWPMDVPDPYYGGPSGFDYVIDMIEAACPRILDHLLGGNGAGGGERGR